MSDSNPPRHKLRWYQYSLSSLFILTILVALASGWYSNEMQKAAERRSRNVWKIVASLILRGRDARIDNIQFLEMFQAEAKSQV